MFLLLILLAILWALLVLAVDGLLDHVVGVELPDWLVWLLVIFGAILIGVLI